MKLSRLDAKDVRKELIEPARALRPVLKRDWLRHVLFSNVFFSGISTYIGAYIFIGFIRFTSFEENWRVLFPGAAFALATSQAVMRAAAKANR